jgi:heme/copper-type cytochrome/quinol oxidase subunit 1
LKNALMSGILLLIRRLWQKARMRSRSTRSYFLMLAFAGSLIHLSLLVIGIKQGPRRARSNSPKTYHLRALSLSIDRMEVRIASPRTLVPSSLILFVNMSVASVTAAASYEKDIYDGTGLHNGNSGVEPWEAIRQSSHTKQSTRPPSKKPVNLSCIAWSKRDLLQPVFSFLAILDRRTDRIHLLAFRRRLVASCV